MPYASAGEPFGWKPFAKPPLQGEVDAPFGADGGVHCRLAAEISCKIRQDIALCFAGDDAGIIPEPCGGFVGRAKTPALQSRRERATTDKSQPSARSVGGPMQASAPTQGGCRSRRRCTYTLYCRAGGHARRGGLRRGDAVVLCKRRTARLGRIEATRKDIGKVLCGTPQSADADSSPYRGAFWVEAVCETSPARGGGCAVRRRRRGALPAGGGDILQNSAGHCPMFRRG